MELECVCSGKDSGGLAVFVGFAADCEVPEALEEKQDGLCGGELRAGVVGALIGDNVNR